MQPEATPDIYIKTPTGTANANHVTLPTTRRFFREAWCLSGEVIAIDMTAAKASALARVRAARQGHLERLDGEWMKAVGRKDPASADAIETKRQKLRDVTVDPRLNASAPEDLRTAVEAIEAEMAAL